MPYTNYLFNLFIVQHMASSPKTVLITPKINGQNSSPATPSKIPKIDRNSIVFYEANWSSYK